MTYRSLRRRGERGLTLVEMLASIALVTIAIVGIVAAIAEAQHVAAISQSQSQLEVAMRQATDYVRDSSSAGLAYKLCANTTTNRYSLPNSSWTITEIDESPYFGPGDARNGGSRNGLVTPPLSTTGCAANTADWGVQEITLSVSDGSRSLTRTVWKSKSW